ncbi:hypothetical protein [Devosia sp. LjRoot3]
MVLILRGRFCRLRLAVAQNKGMSERVDIVVVVKPLALLAHALCPQ